MLDIVRNLVSSIFGKILLGIMVLSFALWGVGDILTSGNSQLAAKVGNQKITLDEFYTKFQKSLREYNLTTKSNLSLNDAKERQMHNIFLNELIYSMMVSDYAKKNGVYLNDNSLKNIITKLPIFVDKNGSFSESKYKNYIFNNFNNEETFLNEIETTLYSGLLFENLNSKNFINQNLIKLLYNYEGEKRSIDYFLLNEDSISIKTELQDLANYFEENKEKYAVESKTIINYIEINLNDFVNKKSITKSMASEYYKDNIDLYTTKEKRTIQFARFNEATDAENFFKVWSDSNNEYLNKYLDEKQININTIQDFSGESFSDEIIDIIFKLKIDEVSKPINYEDIGQYVFKVLDIKNEEIIKFEEVYNQIVEYLSFEDAYDEYDLSLNEIDEMLINDYDLSEIANSFTNIKVTENVDINELVLLINDSETVLSSESPIGYTSELIIKDKAAYIFKITNKLNSYVPDFNDIEDQIKDDYIQSKQLEKVKSLSEKLLLDLQFKGVDYFRNYVNSKNFTIKSKNDISRISNDYSKETMEEIFLHSIGTNFILSNKNNEIGIGIITNIKSPTETISDTFYKKIKDNVIDNYNSSLESVFGKEIIDSTTYEVYLQNIDKLIM